MESSGRDHTSTGHENDTDNPADACLAMLIRPAAPDVDTIQPARPHTMKEMDLRMRSLQYERDLLAHQLKASAAERTALKQALRDLRKQMQSQLRLQMLHGLRPDMWDPAAAAAFTSEIQPSLSVLGNGSLPRPVPGSSPSRRGTITTTSGAETPSDVYMGRGLPNVGPGTASTAAGGTAFQGGGATPAASYMNTAAPPSPRGSIPGTPRGSGASSAFAAAASMANSAVANGVSVAEVGGTSLVGSGGSGAWPLLQRGSTTGSGDAVLNSNGSAGGGGAVNSGGNVVRHMSLGAQRSSSHAFHGPDSGQRMAEVGPEAASGFGGWDAPLTSIMAPSGHSMVHSASYTALPPASPGSASLAAMRPPRSPQVTRTASTPGGAATLGGVNGTAAMASSGDGTGGMDNSNYSSSTTQLGGRPPRSLGSTGNLLPVHEDGYSNLPNSWGDASGSYTPGGITGGAGMRLGDSMGIHQMFFGTYNMHGVPSYGVMAGMESLASVAEDHAAGMDMEEAPEEYFSVTTPPAAASNPTTPLAPGEHTTALAGAAAAAESTPFIAAAGAEAAAAMPGPGALAASVAPSAAPLGGQELSDVGKPQLQQVALNHPPSAPEASLSQQSLNQLEHTAKDLVLNIAPITSKHAEVACALDELFTTPPKISVRAAPRHQDKATTHTSHISILENSMDIPGSGESGTMQLLTQMLPGTAGSSSVPVVQTVAAPAPAAAAARSAPAMQTLPPVTASADAADAEQGAVAHTQEVLAAPASDPFPCSSISLMDAAEQAGTAKPGADAEQASPQTLSGAGLEESGDRSEHGRNSSVASSKDTVATFTSWVGSPAAPLPVLAPTGQLTLPRLRYVPSAPNISHRPSLELPTPPATSSATGHSTQTFAAQPSRPTSGSQLPEVAIAGPNSSNYLSHTTSCIATPTAYMRNGGSGQNGGFQLSTSLPQPMSPPSWRTPQPSPSRPVQPASPSQGYRRAHTQLGSTDHPGGELPAWVMQQPPQQMQPLAHSISETAGLLQKLDGIIAQQQHEGYCGIMQTEAEPAPTPVEGLQQSANDFLRAEKLQAEVEALRAQMEQEQHDRARLAARLSDKEYALQAAQKERDDAEAEVRRLKQIILDLEVAPLVLDPVDEKGHPGTPSSDAAGTAVTASARMPHNRSFVSTDLELAGLDTIENVMARIDQPWSLPTPTAATPPRASSTDLDRRLSLLQMPLHGEQLSSSPSAALSFGADPASHTEVDHDDTTTTRKDEETGVTGAGEGGGEDKLTTPSTAVEQQPGRRSMSSGQESIDGLAQLASSARAVVNEAAAAGGQSARDFKEADHITPALSARSAVQLASSSKGQAAALRQQCRDLLKDILGSDSDVEDTPLHHAANVAATAAAATLIRAASSRSLKARSPAVCTTATASSTPGEVASAPALDSHPAASADAHGSVCVEAAAAASPIATPAAQHQEQLLQTLRQSSSSTHVLTPGAAADRSDSDAQWAADPSASPATASGQNTRTHSRDEESSFSTNDGSSANSTSRRTSGGLRVSDVDLTTQTPAPTPSAATPVMVSPTPSLTSLVHAVPGGGGDSDAPTTTRVSG